MEWLNYHHLLYFWVTAREGSITRAGERLNLAQPTVSGQIQSLEKAIGDRLFLRQGRRLALTETGRVVFGYADQIFALGQELLDTLRNRPTTAQRRVRVGIADAVPKLVACRLLERAIDGDPPVQLTCREGRAEDLLTELATFALDLVISDAPIPPNVKVKAFNHLLGESPVAVFGTAALAERLTRGFPDSLDGAPMLLPTADTVLRQQIDGWFESAGIRPRVVAEFEDSAMMKSFGQRGTGLFPASAFIERDVCAQYGVRALGTLDGVREQVFAITVDRRIKNTAVREITEHASRRFADLQAAATRAG